MGGQVLDAEGDIEGAFVKFRCRIDQVDDILTHVTFAGKLGPVCAVGSYTDQGNLPSRRTAIGRSNGACEIDTTAIPSCRPIIDLPGEKRVAVDS